MEQTKKALQTQYDQLYIAGDWVNSSNNETVKVISPFDQSEIGYTVLAGKEDVDKAVKAARETFDSGVWVNKPYEEREGIILRFMEIYRGFSEQLAVLTTHENGSPIWFTSSLQQMIEFQNLSYLQAGKETEWEKITRNENGGGSIVRKEAVGVVAAIIPWNAPQQSALVKIVPALLAGCTVIFKPTPETSLDGIALGTMFTEAGLPKGVLSILPANREISEYLVSHPDVDKIAFTGSTKAGKTIASIAGSQMKRFSLELGGKSAGIILEDADPSMIAALGRYSAFTNNGQSCAGITRLLVPKSRYEEISGILKEAIENIKLGNPQNHETFLGPVYNETQYLKIKAYIQSGIEEGAVLLTGGLEKLEGEEFEKGWFIRPALFINVKNTMKIAREEIFGPVQVLIAYDNLEEAIALANDSEYGLGGAVITSNVDKGLEVAKAIRTGTVMINAAQPDFKVPFGGYKQSGVGREFGSYGLSSFTELKTILY
ncbi:aldehyde dehydrogenase [Chryseobacterium sp. MIQD13]|uniref:aldehyde dehydrogenase n=1 Tax=Chryseobacterium sp. MIQD13 TaxID=3422310 RepID=UPI003D2696DD